MSEQATTESPNAAQPEAVTHGTFAEAFVAAQAEMPAVERDQTNPHFKSKFASLGHMLAKTRPVLNRHGLAVIQAPVLDGEGRFVLRTILKHTSGEALEFDAPLSPTKDDPQGQGSAITYMRRYALGSALAIADQEDDDGNGASATGPNLPGATTTRRNGQNNGQRATANPDQRRKIIRRAKEIGLADYQTKAWLEFTAGTPHTDRIEKAKATELIKALTGFETVEDALAAFNAALEAGDERAEAIASKHRGGGES